MYTMLTLLGLVPFVVALQVIRLGMVEDDQLREVATSQADTEILIPALRGMIQDVNGRILAGDRVQEQVTLDPTAAGFDQSGEHVSILAGALNISEAELRRRIRSRTSTKFVLLARDAFLSEAHRGAINAVPGARVTRRYARYSRYGATASHILGYVDTEMHGLEGIERQYDELLTGSPGYRPARRDMRGVRRLLPGGEVKRPEHGTTVRLTIDIVRQTILEEELLRGARESGANWAVAMAVDPWTGAILGMASYPTYDVNRPGSSPQAARKNAGISNRIEPGSTFKLIAAVAGIETGVVSMSDTFHTGNGYKRIAGWPIRDTHGYGSIPFHEVIAKSSNIGFAQLSQRMDGSKFYQYARAMGFGQPLGLDLPGEVDGSLKRPADWDGSSFSSMSRGYTVEVTPLQMLMAYAALANGGVLMRPYIVAAHQDINDRVIWEARPDSLRRAFSRETARTLLPAFEEVVQSGTAESAQIAGMRIAGKTGTARKVIDSKYVDGKYRASFAGFFPAEKPVVAMIVVMDEPKSSIYGGSTAAPVFQAIAARWMNTFDDQVPTPLFADTDSTRALPRVPNVTRLPLAVAERQLAIHGFRAEASRGAHEFDVVQEQTPNPTDDAEWGSSVRFALNHAVSPLEEMHGDQPGLETGDLLMPEVLGLGARDAAFMLAGFGIQARFEGSGTVVEQRPKAGTAVHSEAVIRLR